MMSYWCSKNSQAAPIRIRPVPHVIRFFIHELRWLDIDILLSYPAGESIRVLHLILHPPIKHLPAFIHAIPNGNTGANNKPAHNYRAADSRSHHRRGCGARGRRPHPSGSSRYDRLQPEGGDRGRRTRIPGQGARTRCKRFFYPVSPVLSNLGQDSQDGQDVEM